MTNTTNESEAMEVWFRAKETFAALWQVLGRDGQHRDATDGDRHQAAARVIATALEARDADLRAMRGALEALVAGLRDEDLETRVWSQFNHVLNVLAWTDGRRALAKGNTHD